MGIEHNRPALHAHHEVGETNRAPVQLTGRRYRFAWGPLGWSARLCTSMITSFLIGGYEFGFHRRPHRIRFDSVALVMLHSCWFRVLPNCGLASRTLLRRTRWPLVSTTARWWSRSAAWEGAYRHYGRAWEWTARSLKGDPAAAREMVSASWAVAAARHGLMSLMPSTAFSARPGVRIVARWTRDRLGGRRTLDLTDRDQTLRKLVVELDSEPVTPGNRHEPCLPDSTICVVAAPVSGRRHKVRPGQGQFSTLRSSFLALLYTSFCLAWSPGCDSLVSFRNGGGQLVEC